MPLAVAKTVILYHEKKINEGLHLIVGYHGDNILKKGISQFISERFGFKLQEDSNNKGKLTILRSG